MDTLCNRLVICGLRSWLQPSEHFWLEGDFFFFFFDEYIMCLSRQTHPHGWRDAPGAGLAVTMPEGAVVPGNRRVELQLMPLFLQGRRMRKDFSLALFTVGVVAVVLASCPEGVLVC